MCQLHAKHYARISHFSKKYGVGIWFLLVCLHPQALAPNSSFLMTWTPEWSDNGSCDWETSHQSTQRMDSDRKCSKDGHVLMILQGCLVGKSCKIRCLLGQNIHGGLQQAIYFLACRSLPQFLIGCVLWGYILPCSCFSCIGYS